MEGAFFIYDVPGETKNVYGFSGLWNKNCVTDIQNQNVNLAVKG